MWCSDTQGAVALANLVAFQGGLSHRAFHAHDSRVNLCYAACSWKEAFAVCCSTLYKTNEYSLG